MNIWDILGQKQRKRKKRKKEMPAATGLYAEGISVTSATTTWVDVCEISAASFTAGKKYLIIASAYVRSSSTSGEVRIRLVHGGVPTEFTDAYGAYEEGIGNAAYCHYGYVTAWEQPGTAELIKLQISDSATNTSTCDLGQIFCLKLSDDFVENTDYLFTEVTADYTTTANASDCSSIEAASVTFTPNGTDDWLILGNGTLTPASTTSNYMASLYDSVEGIDQPAIDVEGEDTTNERRVFLLHRTWTPSNASHTFQLRFWHESSAHTIHSSRIFAINLNSFSQHSFSYLADEEQPSNAAWTTTRTLSPTPLVTGNWFILGGFNNDVGNAGGEGLSTRLQINAAGGGLASDPNYGDDAPRNDGWDDTDVTPFAIFKMLSLSSGAARDINLDVTLDTGDVLERVENRHLVAFSLELPSAAAGNPWYAYQQM